MNPRAPSCGNSEQSGFSLVELMVAITLGLAVLAGLTTIFVSNNQSRNEIERTNRQIENGRYAMQLLAEDLRNAGFLGEFDPTSLPTPTTLPDPCSTTLADINTALPLQIQGYDDASSIPSCISDVKAGTDIVVVRRASTCAVGDTNCDAITAGVPYFQASLCFPSSGATELASTNISDYYALATDTSTLTEHKRDCTTTAAIRRFETHIYFIANNDSGSDGIPTLKRAELGTNGSSTAFVIVPLVEGIENLQLEYGIDNLPSSGKDGIPDVYTADPSSYNGCTGQACVQNWRDVVAVRMHLLARNTEESAGYSNTGRTYSLGYDKDDAIISVGGFTDTYKRHVYESSVKLTNPAGRRGS